VVILLGRGANDLRMIHAPDVTATPTSHLLKSRKIYLSVAGLARLPWERGY